MLTPEERKKARDERIAAMEEDFARFIQSLDEQALANGLSKLPMELVGVMRVAYTQGRTDQLASCLSDVVMVKLARGDLKGAPSCFN